MSTFPAGPRLLTARLIRGNQAAGRRRWWLTAGGVCVAGLLLALTVQPALASAFDWLQQHVLMASILLAIATSALVARHRTATRAEFAKSWLAALPTRGGIARREARQKLSILLALVGDPTLIVLDEAFNGLDPASALIVKRHLRGRLQQRGASLLLATHALDIVEHYADRAAVLIDGKLKREWQKSEIDALRESGRNFEHSLADTIAQ
jgi:ABC-type branched-subunit amino acid transport system ATPase component